MRLYIVVEGQTEAEFVDDVLRPHLWQYNIDAKYMIVTTRRDGRTGKKFKGGGLWKHWYADIRRLVGEQHGKNVRFTTMFDLYGLPKDFPTSSKHAAVTDTTQRVRMLEEAMQNEVGDWRLIPYLQRHEFEALVLTDLVPLKALFDTEENLAGIDRLQASITGQQPEDINDGPATAPSKRLTANIPGYQKTLHGPLVLEAVGLAALRVACPRFDAWVTRLEQLAASDQT